MKQLTLWPKLVSKKRCLSCGEVKDFEQFGKDRRVCLVCRRLKARRYHLAKTGKPEDTPYRPYNPENRCKGAKRIDEGYVFVNCGNGTWKAEHRMIMEAYLKRTLKTEEQVHHINGVKTDNRRENLFIFNRREHSTGHLKTKIDLAKTQWQMKWLNSEMQKLGREVKRLRVQNKELSQMPLHNEHALAIYKLRGGNQ